MERTNRPHHAQPIHSEVCKEIGPLTEGITPGWSDDAPTETKKQYAWVECKRIYGEINQNGGRLKDARYVRASEGKRHGKVYCTYCYHEPHNG